MKTLIHIFLAAAFTATFALSGLAENPQKKNSDINNIGNRNINKGSLNFTSIEKEILLGRQLADEVERQVKLLKDPEINEYVNRVGQNIVSNSDSKVPFTIKVIDSEE